MSRKLIRPVTIKNARYIIVDSMNWHGRKIYRVFQTIDEKTHDMLMIHAVYENGRYIDVDEIEELAAEPEEDTVKFKDLAIDPHLRDASAEQVDILKREQIHNFLWLNSHIEEKLPIGKIIKAIKQVPIKVYDESESVSKSATTRGYFDEENMFIAFASNEINNVNRQSMVSRFHEFIHYIQHVLSKEPEKILNDVMTEAQTESLALSRDTILRARPIFFLKTRKPTMAVFNYPADCYIYAVSILRQMEAIMGRKSYDKDFASDREFPNEFIKKYGKDLYTYLYARMNALEYEENEEIDANKGYYISETQDKLMKEAFRQDFEKMKTIEDAKDILTRLRNLETERIDLYVKEENEDIVPLGHYEEYYQQLFQRIGKRLVQLGYSKDEILQHLEEYQYEEQSFHPVLPEEIFVENIRKNVEKGVIKKFQKEEHQSFNPDRHKIVYALFNNGDYLIGVGNRKNNKLISLRYCPGEITSFTESEDFEMTQEILEYLESPNAPELKLPKQIYKKYKRLTQHNVQRRNNNDGR